jgi:hypothetical protein
MGTLPGGSASLGSFDAQHLQHVEKIDAATRLHIIALKAHVTQLAVNQAEMIALQTQGHKFPELVPLDIEASSEVLYR